MIVIRVKVQVTDANKADFIATMQEFISISREFAGCLDFNLYEAVGDDNTLLLYEEWESQSHFNTYRTSDHFQESGKVLFPLMQGEPDSAYFKSEKFQ